MLVVSHISGNPVYLEKAKSKKQPFQLVLKEEKLLVSKIWKGIEKKEHLSEENMQNFKTQVKMEQAEARHSKGRKRQRYREMWEEQPEGKWKSKERQKQTQRTRVHQKAMWNYLTVKTAELRGD